MSVVNEITVRFGADIAPLQQGVARANATLDGIATAGKRATTSLTAVSTASATVAKQSAATASAMNTVRSSMTSVAAAALQTAPGVAQLGSVIGSLAVGAPVMIGVLLGMTALGYAWDAITSKAKEAKKATEGALEALGKLAGVTPAMAIQESITTARAEVSRLQIEGDKLRQNRKRVRGPTTGIDADIAANAAEIGRVQGLIQRGEDEITALYLSEGAKRDAERLEQQKQGERDRQTAALKAAQETLQALEKLEQQFASKRSTFRTPLGAMATNAPVAPLGAMVALGGVAVPNAGNQSAGLTSTGPSAAASAMDMAAQSALGLVSSFSPLGLMSVALGSAFEALQPAIDVLLMPVRAFGKLIGGIVGGALSRFAEGLGWVIRSIGKLVNLLPGSPGSGLVNFGQEMIDAAQAARRAADGSDALAEATQRAADSVTNMPDIFDLALRRRQAALGGVAGGGMVPGGAGGPGGGITVHIHNPPINLDTDRVVRQVTRGLVEATRRGGTPEIALAFRALTPASL